MNISRNAHLGLDAEPIQTNLVRVASSFVRQTVTSLSASLTLLAHVTLRRVRRRHAVKESARRHRYHGRLEWRETTVQHSGTPDGRPWCFCFAFDQLRVKGDLLK